MVSPFRLLKRLLVLGFSGLAVLVGLHEGTDWPYTGTLVLLYVVGLVCTTMWIIVPMVVIQHSWGQKRHGVFSHLKEESTSPKVENLE